ncbi:MAG: penicillin acylase family protein [Gemmatimonadaceae bacterium]
MSQVAKALSVVVPTTTLGAVSQPAERQRWERLASQVTIYRDTWGVAHVHGTTDAAAMFGSTYAAGEPA